MKPQTVLYELDAVISDDLTPAYEALGEALDRSEESLAVVVGRFSGPYGRGEISQGVFWNEIAAELGMANTDVVATHAFNAAQIAQPILGRIRAQSDRFRLGLVSDATPDWVGHWRKTLELDRLVHVHVIGSDFAVEQTYPDLLRIAAERLLAKPADVWFVDAKPAHLEAARKLGMRTIDLSTEDPATAFSKFG